ncbi:hypothetical protein ASG01_08865 [Chryseobacterium sp. Leaf180]|uniref:hypothetical protein n=1 Tax=Chryseobacterium sp. Leaf180 TaxID=1736289 RepID=UPI00070044EA|nr:hypothetical protein [Chryseobacterium sp. Leaf180]KQR93298.1 hypothetical protein ASG01_08865 [Chryseobacterium sp. Leaf180]
MINHNTLLYDLLDKTLKATFNGAEWVVNYTEGDLSELSRKLNDSTTKYPIIWLQSGYSVERSIAPVLTKIDSCKIFFITKGSTIDRYEKRYDSTYQDVLYPLLVRFDELIRKTKGISASNTDNFTTFPYNDSTDINKGEQKITVTDTWDALLLETGLTISDGCYPQYLIK